MRCLKLPGPGARQLRATHRASAGSGAGQTAGRGRPPCASASCGSARTSGRHSWCRCGPGGVGGAVTGGGEAEGENTGEETLPLSTEPSPRRATFRCTGPGWKRQESDVLIRGARLSRPQPYWHLGPDRFCWRGGPVHGMVFGSIWPLSIRCQWHPPHSGCDNLKMSQDTVHVPGQQGWGQLTHHGLRTTDPNQGKEAGAPMIRDALAHRSTTWAQIPDLLSRCVTTGQLLVLSNLLPHL